MSGRTNNDVSAAAGENAEIASGGSDDDTVEDSNPDELDPETLAVELAYWKLYRKALGRRCN